MIVSEVGRMTKGSASFAGGDHLRRAVGLLLRLQAMMRDHGALRGKTFRVLRLLFEIAQRDQQREIGVHMPGGLELHIELALDVLPEAVAPGLDDHAAAHLGVFGHVSGADDLLIPFGKSFSRVGVMAVALLMGTTTAATSSSAPTASSTSASATTRSATAN
jgi:hypothetical protein